MKLGICLPHYGRPIEVPRMLEVARHAEARGLGFQALGCQHIALEVSYSTYPAILQTIDVIAERRRPPVVE